MLSECIMIRKIKGITQKALAFHVIPFQFQVWTYLKKAVRRSVCEECMLLGLGMRGEGFIAQIGECDYQNKI